MLNQQLLQVINKTRIEKTQNFSTRLSITLSAIIIITIQCSQNFKVPSFSTFSLKVTWDQLNDPVFIYWYLDVQVDRYLYL